MNQSLETLQNRFAQDYSRTDIIISGLFAKFYIVLTFKSGTVLSKSKHLNKHCHKIVIDKISKISLERSS
uniref:Uncharacterized protein n=1 Tax=Glossina palpalis gambiensis TaxID=67801 RepID=A0A1B0BY07_9MUSC